MSRFVSGGNVDEPVERDDAWLKAQQEIEAKRRQKEEEGRQEGGKSLYETLQANKAAKQEAFEESARLKNQFRSLDEDEVDFLDSVLESTRAKEAAVKKETAEQLDLFRRQQEESEKAAQGESVDGIPAEEVTWAVSGKKRKRNKDKEALPGVKLRKSSSVADKPEKSLAESKEPHSIESSTAKDDPKLTPPPTLDSTKSGTGPATEASKSQSPSPPAASLGLAAYSSDED